MSNDVMATIESARVGRRHEEGTRFFALVSMPINGNEQLVLSLMKNIHNPMHLNFGAVQAELLPPSSDTDAAAAAGAPPAEDSELVDMVVNGEPAKVRRPRTRSNGHEPETAHEDGTPISGVAEGLIEEARRLPADEAEAAEQAEALERRAHRSS